MRPRATTAATPPRPPRAAVAAASLLVTAPAGFAYEAPLIALAGTRSWRDVLLCDLNVAPRWWPPDGRRRAGDARARGGLVHGGFALRARRLLEGLHPHLGDDDGLLVAGYSLGGGCAPLVASALVDAGRHVRGVYTFGAPPLARPGFRDLYRAQGLWNVTRNYHTPRDPVATAVPDVYYHRVGEDVPLACDDVTDAWEQHDMRTYLRLIAAAE